MGSAFLFFPMLAGQVIITLVVLAFAAHCFLTVLQDTAAGVDAVRWPDEPYQDWIARAAYIATIVAIWVVPAGFAWRMSRNDFLPDDSGLRFVLLTVPGLWLLFPVGLLCALGSKSRWALVNPRILRDLGRILPSFLGFYVSSAVVVAATVALWYVAFTRGDMTWLIPASLLNGAAVLIYGRLLGRVAWLLQRLKPLKRDKSQSEGFRPLGKVLIDAPPPTADRAAIEMAHVPDDDEDDGRPAAPATPAAKKAYVEEPSTPYEVSEQEQEPSEFSMAESYTAKADLPRKKRKKKRGPEADRQRDRDRMRPADEPKPYVPAVPLVTGVYTFPFYSESVRAWVLLSAGVLLASGWLMVLASVFPF